MKKNRVKALLLLSSLPFLTAMMYNGPHFYVSNYSSYDVTYVSHEQVDENYVYTLNIKNTGHGYLYAVNLEGTIEEESHSLSTHKMSEVFIDCVIGYYEETTIKLTSSKEIPDISKLNKKGEAYSLSDSSIEKFYATGENFVESVTLYDTHPDNDNCAFEYKVNFKQGVNTNSACALFEMTYDGKPLSLMLDGSSEGYHFYTREEIDLTKLEVEQMTFVAQYRAFTPSGEGILMVSLIIIGVMLLISGVIFLVVFFFVRFLIRKNRKVRADLPK